MAWRSGKSMKIRLRDGLPFISASLLYQGREITLENVLLDTGSAGTLFATDAVSAVGLTYEPQDSVHRIRGVGGAEFVFTKRVDRLSVDTLHADDFEIEVGAMDYGFGFVIEGIVGTDFLVRTKATIDLDRLEVRPAP